jgi:phosphatidylglycerophosphate synthase
MAFTAFFFLITVVDTNNKVSLGVTWLKTLVVYMLFVMTTKAKLPAILAIVLLLIVDLSLKTHIQYVQRNNPDQEQSPSRYEKYRTYTQYMLYAVIVLGFLHYAFYQEKSYGNNFSLSTFLFGTGKCHK